MPASANVTADEFKKAMASFAGGVTVITTLDSAGRPWGLTATAFSAVSKTPPLCLVCVSHEADAHPALVATQKFVVNVLSREQETVSSRFATHGIDKFEGVAWTRGSATGCPLIVGALASVECEVSSSMAAGDHDVLVGAIQAVHVAPGDPLLYFRGRYADLAPR